MTPKPAHPFQVGSSRVRVSLNIPRDYIPKPVDYPENAFTPDQCWLLNLLLTPGNRHNQLNNPYELS